MDIDQIRTFDRIAQDLSFTKAAASLNVTQATVSMRMRALEELLGVTLFNRGRKVTLTDQGMSFLPYARRMLSAAQEGREALRRAERGRVSVGCLRSLILPLITDPLLRFQDAYPNVDVLVEEGSHRDLTAMLHDRQVELAIVVWPNLDPLMPDIEPLLVMREEAPLMVSPGVAEQLGDSFDVADLLELVPRVISLGWWQVEPDAAVALARRAQTFVDIPAGPARRLAMRGVATGPFIRSSVAEDLAEGRLVAVYPRDFAVLHRDVALVALPGATQERPMLRDFATEIARECSAVGKVIENWLG